MRCTPDGRTNDWAALTGQAETKPLRILFSHRIPPHDRQSVQVQALITAFLLEGHAVRVVGPATAVRRPLPRVLQELATLAGSIPAHFRLRAACHEFAPDLIYEHYDSAFLAGAVLARRQHLPYFLEVTAPPAEAGASHGGPRLRRLAWALERFVWRSADRILVGSSALGQAVVATGMDPSRVSVVPGGVVPEHYLPAPFAPAGPHMPGRCVIGVVGPLWDRRGPEAVIRAIAAPDAGPTGAQLCLTVIGEGPARAELEKLAATLGISRQVRVIRPIAPALMPHLMAEFDIALQPSLPAHAAPVEIFAYMAAGCAIVAPDQPNIREILADGQTALLFDPNREGAMWQAVARLIDNAPLRARLGAAARADLERCDYSWRGKAARIVRCASNRGGYHGPRNAYDRIARCSSIAPNGEPHDRDS
jgi:glycosyltransferase involved in cell wall biosynthesis